MGYLDAAVLRACAAKSENGLLDRCLGQSSSKILKVLEPSEVYPLLGFLFLIIMILGVLFKIFRSNEYICTSAPAQPKAFNFICDF